FSEQSKFSTFRKLWVLLAQSEKELGLPITDKQINELKSHIDDIDFETAQKIEKEVRHDVMSHVKAYGLQCPDAAGIIHLGATSCYVGDNTDVILMKNALDIVIQKTVSVIKNLADFALKYADTPTLGYTHYQPAQPTTVGKRATLWMYDLLCDLEQLEFACSSLRLLGCKGTTGTSASFLELFEGDTKKVKKLEDMICEAVGIKAQPVSGQTYTRKQDSTVIKALSGLSESAMKFAGDLRLLQHEKEIEEPFEKNQIGSSAMAYKRNPMRSERISSLARFVMSLVTSPEITAGTQWLERTLDDSAARRLYIPQAFLAVDGILNLYINISQNLVVNEKMIEKHLCDELPFMATENILMDAVKKGGDRQELHEIIRQYSMEAGAKVKSGEENDLLDRLCADSRFMLSKEDLQKTLKPENYVGMAPTQTREFIKDYVEPILKSHKAFGENVDITV
ncbi:MAG: adenylosuccinate lyase, partial [Oscillospiraceae bacterium]|nr:adenylosuccinate lyase [Candidatus Equicaccousia limihippi]